MKVQRPKFVAYATNFGRGSEAAIVCRNAGLSGGILLIAPANESWHRLAVCMMHCDHVEFAASVPMQTQFEESPR
jgi:hypothetical protein